MGSDYSLLLRGRMGKQGWDVTWNMEHFAAVAVINLFMLIEMTLQNPQTH